MNGAADVKDILALIDLAGRRPAATAALDLAALTGAHVTGLAMVYDLMIRGFAVAPMPGEIVAAALEQAEQDAKAMAAAFEELGRRAGVSYGTRTVKGVVLGGLDEIVRQARLTDLCVIGQDDPDRPEPLRNAILEAVLFDAGTPTLVVPYIHKGPLKLGRVLLAWDGSLRAARAVRAAMPVLARAGRIEILLVEDADAADPAAGYGIGEWLARHGLDVSVRQVPRARADIADILLNTVTELGADLVVMGAYGHARLREYVFGGATYDILWEMTVPVLMAH